MGQKVSFKLIDRSMQHSAKWTLYLFVLKLLNKLPDDYLSENYN